MRHQSIEHNRFCLNKYCICLGARRKGYVKSTEGVGGEGEGERGHTIYLYACYKMLTLQSPNKKTRTYVTLCLLKKLNI